MNLVLELEIAYAVKKTNVLSVTLAEIVSYTSPKKEDVQKTADLVCMLTSSLRLVKYAHQTRKLAALRAHQQILAHIVVMVTSYRNLMFVWNAHKIVFSVSQMDVMNVN